MIKYLIFIIVLFPLAYAESEEDIEKKQIIAIIEKYSDFNLHEELDQQHATWLCTIYYNKHSKLSGAPGKAEKSEGGWRCPIRYGIEGKVSDEFIFVNSDSLIVSRGGWPLNSGQALLSEAIRGLKREIR